MKLKSIITVASTVLLASTAFAAGNHAGGHGDSEAIGKPGKASNAKRSITVDMTDAMRFTPDSIMVKQGETIKFFVKNSGKIKHEMVLGTEKELKAHYEAMKKNPEMEHADENQVTVQPGESGQIIWQFTNAGKVNFACLQPGHFDAGMKGAVVVGGKAVASTTTQSTPALAQVKVAPTQAPTTIATATEMSDGEIRKVDLESKKITIKHGDIKNLDMPGMTMVFQVKDAAILSKVKAGDKVKFAAEKIAGAIVVTDIQANK